MPRRYRFVAPKGAGPKLSHLLSHTDQLHTALMDALKDDGALKQAEKAFRATVADALSSIDLSVFDVEQLDHIVEIHRDSPYHLFRFGGQLEERPPSPSPPHEFISEEAVYVEKLMTAYREREGKLDMTWADVAAIEWYKNHLSRQRVSFFSAEALRTFARDKVPPRTFESLQDEIYDGVVEVEQSSHKDGLDRLTSVLNAACNVQLSGNALITVSKPVDKKGICHQLANEDRLDWVKE